MVKDVTHDAIVWRAGKARLFVDQLIFLCYSEICHVACFHFSVVYTYEVLTQRKSIWQPMKLDFV